jgi:HemY protein
MFKISWYVFVIFILSISIVWIIENNGSILINWIGYEIETDILSALILVGFIIVFLVIFLIIISKILSFKFPKLHKFFFKKSYINKLEKIIKNHHKSFDHITNIMIAIEANEIEDAKKIYQDLQKLTKHKYVNNFFAGKFALNSNDIKKAKIIFNEYSENSYAKILLLKTEFKEAIQDNSVNKAINIGNKILELKSHEIDVAKELAMIYLKINQISEIEKLFSKFGCKRFSNKFSRRELLILNTAIANYALQNRKFIKSIKYSRKALKIEADFLPAQIIYIKTFLKIGLNKIALLNLKKYWKKTPNLALVEIFNFINRKSKINKKLKKLRKFIFSINNKDLANAIFAKFAFKLNEYSLAKESIIKANYLCNPVNSYLLMSNIEKKFGNQNDHINFLNIAKNIQNTSHYQCEKCNYKYAKWDINCTNCGAFDSLKF